MMPGTFSSEEEENGFLERMKASPPAAVIWPARPFDDLPERAVESVAPRLSEWVQANYRITREKQHRWIVMFPNEKGESGAASASQPQRTP